MKKYKRGITFGAFEIFHQGHYNILHRAKQQCDELVVGLSSDEYIEKIKKHKAVIPWDLRREIVAAVKYVDYVDKQSLHKNKQILCSIWDADVIFVGDDWKDKDWDGAKLGIPVIYLPRTEGISSSQLRK